MQQLVHSQPYSRPGGRRRFVLRLLRLALAVFISASSFAAASIAARALGWSAPSPANPFVDYMDILPGQADSAVHSRGFGCYSGNYNYYDTLGRLQVICTLHPASGAFSSVDVFLRGGSVIEASFILRDDRLRVGDLSAWWEMNPAQSYPQLVFFVLPEWVVMGRISETEHATSFSPMWSVTFVEKAVFFEDAN